MELELRPPHQIASETAADLKSGFERIRAAGRVLQDARRQFDLGT